jgi:PAS domain S-box-containing protein
VIELSRYVFEALRKDEEFVLYRGQRRDVASRILVLAPARQRPLPESLKRLENENSLKEQLDPTWATRPVAIAAHWDRTVLLLEDPGGVPLRQLLDSGRDAFAELNGGKQPDIAPALRLAISLSAAIGALHKRGVIHKDIQPANVLVNPATGQCWLTGFGIASRLPRERQPAAPPEVIAGTLPYMAPEQTGRMNRSIDSRSDLYALGITLYEILTGSLPYTASDPLEWVHCQVARQAVPPQERSKAVPASVSAIVMKLLAKTAEERYQTAAGVERDLRRCLAEWEARRTMVEFPLGEHDWPDQLRIPEKLYGRAREIDTLLASFDNVVASGRPELVLVSGYSGVGKSSVVNELHKVLVPPRGLFASGKFDQYKRDIPYSTLAQAFQSLVRPLLGQREAELRVWRDAFRDALGPNGLLMVNLVPELKLVIGEQPAVPELPPQDAKARFRLVLQRFVGVFARPEHPLALFLDDLQWLDAATLDFLQDLLTQPDLHHLLLFGAYRDNEVDSSHPLWRKLEAIRQTGTHVHEIVLAPLTSKDLGRLLVDSLHREPERVTPLARLVHEKTAGNPFFAIQFVSALAEEQLLTFDHGDGKWSWDLSRIQAKSYTDNVVDLMVGKLNRLPVETQKTLKEFACLGNSAEVTTLSIVRGTSEAEVRSDLWEALRLELIVRLEGSYKFLHDRIHEAAYSLIPEELRSQAHLRIGRLLKASTAPERRAEAIFEIVNQLNRGAALISSPGERVQLAEFNVIAGKRAKEATAFTSALNYLAAGAAMLPDDSWQSHHQLTFELELHRAECEFLTGRSSDAEKRLAMLSSRAATAVELATVTCLYVDLYTTLDQSDRAVAICLEYLRHLGVEWSPHPTEEEARREYENIWIKIGSRTIEELINLQVMSDLTSLGTLDVLTKVLPAALFTDANLMSLFVCRMVNLTLEHGVSDGSSFAYVCLGMIAGPHFGNYKDAFRFGRLGYELIEKRGLKRFRARTYMVFGTHVIPWTKGLRGGRDLIQRAFEVANQIGDLCFAAYSCVNLNTNLLAAGSPLIEVQREAEYGLDFARKVRFGAVIDHISSQLGLIRTLRDSTPTFGSFDDGQFNEIRFERHLAAATAAQPGCFYWILKLQARFFSGDYASAVEASLEARRLLWTASSHFETAEYHFYSALARAAAAHSATFSFAEGSAREDHLRALAKHHQQLALWADNCPMNFENRVALVGAEIARIENRELDAERFYEQAIRSSHVNGFIQNEALASELAGRFYAARGFDLIGQGYLRKARAGYLAWGAIGKVRQLDEAYPQLGEGEHVPIFTNTIGAPVDQLDLATVIKASQTLSSEIIFEKLIDTLLRMAIEHAGAERGLLILPRGLERRIEAEATTNGDTIIVHLQEAATADDALPESIIHYVSRTQESVILDDASAQNPFSADTYIRRRRARSILCVPLINQTKLIGLLYLENNLAPHVFTTKRIAVLKLLASQAAISLENTRLYRDLEEREAKIRRLVDANIMGIYIWNLEGEVIEANEAFLHMVEYSREDFVSGRVRWPDLTPAEWRDRDQRAVAEIKATGTLQPFQKEYFRKNGSRLPVMVGGAMFGGSKNEGVAFVLDLSQQKHAEDERKRAEDALQEAQTELEHVTRVAALGELTASIAHEINQPLGAVVNNASACLRWLRANNLEEARQSASLVIAEGHRAGEIISRIRALAKKTPPHKDWLDINETIGEVLAMARNAAQRSRISFRTQLANDLPLILGDKIQLQQVILNLLINAIEAMSELNEGPRKLWASSQRFTKMPALRPRTLQAGKADDFGARAWAEAEGAYVLIAVRDSGPGLDPKCLDRLFDAFYTTKPQGLGMGLAVSRSIIEAHGGGLWAEANVPRGAVFQFTLPLGQERVS